MIILRWRLTDIRAWRGAVDISDFQSGKERMVTFPVTLLHHTPYPLLILMQDSGLKEIRRIEKQLLNLGCL